MTASTICSVRPSLNPAPAKASIISFRMNNKNCMNNLQLILKISLYKIENKKQYVTILTDIIAALVLSFTYYIAIVFALTEITFQ